MSNIVDLLAYKKKKEEDEAWNYLQSGAIYNADEIDYLLSCLENININDPGTFHVEGDTIYITLEENSLKQEDE